MNPASSSKHFLFFLTTKIPMPSNTRHACNLSAMRASSAWEKQTQTLQKHDFSKYPPKN